MLEARVHIEEQAMIKLLDRLDVKNLSTEDLQKFDNTLDSKRVQVRCELAGRKHEELVNGG